MEPKIIYTKKTEQDEFEVYDNHTVRYFEITETGNRCEIDGEIWNDALIDAAADVHETAAELGLFKAAQEPDPEFLTPDQYKAIADGLIEYQQKLWDIKEIFDPETDQEMTDLILDIDAAIEAARFHAVGK